VRYHGSGNDELHLVFNFPLMRTPRLTPGWVQANQEVRLAALPPGAWPCNTLGNHDSARVWSRYGDGKHDAALARLALALVLTLPGTPFLYNGEEIGMTDLLLSDLAQMKDMIAIWRYHAEREANGLSHAAAVAVAAEYGRDKCRTPMQWANAPNGGFCPDGVAPWLPVNPNYAEGVNVAEQDGDPGALLDFYRRLLRARRATPALRLGGYTPVNPAAADTLVYWRSWQANEGGESQNVLVALNFSAAPQVVLVEGQRGTARVVFSSAARPAREELAEGLRLAPFVVWIGEWSLGMGKQVL
jgi:alpha-glucosidase